MPNEMNARSNGPNSKHLGGRTGYKYTKQKPNKNTVNQIKRSNASSVPGRKIPKGQEKNNNLRSADTIRRLKMYNNGKAIRNVDGKVVGGAFMMDDRAGDRKITASTGRIAPDRRWFGNTRVIAATELDKFREEMNTKTADPYSVVVARKKLPMGLLTEAAGASSKAVKEGLLSNESFSDAFGSKKKRKRVAIDQLLSGRSDVVAKKGKGAVLSTITDGATLVDVATANVDGGYGALLKVACESNDIYAQTNNAEGMVQWGKDGQIEVTEGEGVDWRHEVRHDMFLKGQSKRIWAELYKVLDCSDVVLHIIDARNVPGTKCDMIEKHIANNAKHKHLIFVLNKIDLVPNWVAKRWVGELSKIRPTIAFHASMTHAFGKGALISLLRQFGKLHEDKKQISVGVVGYPNVGKSSVINTLISQNSCRVAPMPGETKIWQYVSLMKRIFLIDCPGVVVDSHGDTDEDAVLKGVVRSERLPDPTIFIPGIEQRVKRAHIAACYGLQEKGETTWKNTDQLLEQIAKMKGRLLKKGELDIKQAAVTMINDFQRGKLPYFVAPPELKDGEGVTPGNLSKVNKELLERGRDVQETTATIKGIKMKKQDLDLIGKDQGDGIDIDDELDEDDDELDGEEGGEEGGDEDEDDEEGDEDDDDEEGGDDDDDDDDSDEDDLPLVVAGGWDDE